MGAWPSWPMSNPTLWGETNPDDEGKPSFGRFPGWRAKNWPWTIRITRPMAKKLTVWETVWIEISPRKEPDE